MRVFGGVLFCVTALVPLTVSAADEAPAVPAKKVPAGAATTVAVAKPTADPATPTTTKTVETAKTAALTPAEKAPVAKTKPKSLAPTLTAVIDLTRQRMTVKSGGKTLHSWKISSGRAGYHTPRGRFRPAWASKMWYSRQYDGAPMPYAVFFNQGIATHGTTSTGMLGRPASHGCIRLRTRNAKRFYTLVHRHGYKRTRIIVKGSTPKTRRRVAKRSSRPRRSYVVSRAPARLRNRRVTVRNRVVRQRRMVVPRPRTRLVFPGDRY